MATFIYEVDHRSLNAKETYFPHSNNSKMFTSLTKAEKYIKEYMETNQKHGGTSAPVNEDCWNVGQHWSPSKIFDYSWLTDPRYGDQKWVDQRFVLTKHKLN